MLLNMYTVHIHSPSNVRCVKWSGRSVYVHIRYQPGGKCDFLDNGMIVVVSNSADTLLMWNIRGEQSDGWLMSKEASQNEHAEHWGWCSTTAETTSGSTPVSQEQKAEAAVTRTLQHWTVEDWKTKLGPMNLVFCLTAWLSLSQRGYWGKRIKTCLSNDLFSTHRDFF